MYASITAVAFSLGGKCLLNWVLLLPQKSHICRSFLGVFSVSLAVVDTALTLTVTTLHFFTNGYTVFLGMQLTRYHICLLVQILGEVYRVLQWPVVLTASLDHFCTVTRRRQVGTFGAKLIVYPFVTGLLWCVAALYVFLQSDFIPVLEDVSPYQMHRCWVFCTTHILKIAVLLLLALGFAALHAKHPLFPQLSLNNPPLDESFRKSFVYQALCIFLKTWSPILVSLPLLLLLLGGLPSYLDLNVAWLCFLNSLLIAFVLCAVCPASQQSQGLAAVPPDRFCEWIFNFSLAAEDQMPMHENLMQNKK